MKNLYSALKAIVSVIAILIFLAGVTLTVLGGFDFVHAFTNLATADKEHFVGLTGVSLLQAIDLFLISIVLYVFALGLLMLFARPDEQFPIKLPEWLRIKSFIQLKMILWEAILTTLVVSYLANLVELKIDDKEIGFETLYIPGGIFLIAISLFFLKKGEH